jgi:hypothetical protein
LYAHLFRQLVWILLFEVNKPGKQRSNQEVLSGNKMSLLKWLERIAGGMERR